MCIWTFFSVCQKFKLTTAITCIILISGVAEFDISGWMEEMIIKSLGLIFVSEEKSLIWSSKSNAFYLCVNFLWWSNYSRRKIYEFDIWCAVKLCCRVIWMINVLQFCVLGNCDNLLWIILLPLRKAHRQISSLCWWICDTAAGEASENTRCQYTTQEMLIPTSNSGFMHN